MGFRERGDVALVVGLFPLGSASASLHSRADVLAKPCPVPKSPGVYAWYFSRVPGGIDASLAEEVDGMKLLYVGISPKEPPTNGRARSRSTLRDRLRTHYSGNAAGSTLRKTLGCLLAEELGLSLRRVGSGNRVTLTNPGEQRLDQWMERNAYVTWVTTDRPWEVELEILRSGLLLPLNIRDNPSVAHTAYLQGVRREAMKAAGTLPILADSGGRRTQPTRAAVSGPT
jgi:hypothetical protein